MTLEDIFDALKEKELFLAATLNTSTLWTGISANQYFYHLKIALIDNVLIEITSDNEDYIINYLYKLFECEDKIVSCKIDIKKGNINVRPQAE